MKLKCTLAAIILLGISLPGFADEFSVVTNRTVDLSFIVERLNTNWIGHVMSDVIGTNKAISVVVLKNNTQMWSEGHAEGIRRILQTNPTLEAKPAGIEPHGKFKDAVDTQFWFDSIVVLENGTIVRLERMRSWGRLTTERGQAYFRISDARPNQAPEATR